MIQNFPCLELSPQAKFNNLFPDPSQSPTTNVSFISQNSHIESHSEPEYVVFNALELKNIEETLKNNEIMLNFYENEENAVMNYAFMDHKSLLPFEVHVNYPNNSLILKHDKIFGYSKNKSLMALLAMKQENFIENFLNAKNVKGLKHENLHLREKIVNMLQCSQNEEEEEDKSSFDSLKGCFNTKMSIMKKKISKIQKQKKFLKSNKELQISKSMSVFYH